MTEEQYQLLLQILGQQGGSGVNPMFANAARAGVTPSSITSLFNPEVLFASGMLDPNQISGGISDMENQLMQKFLVETTSSVPVPLETTPMWFRDITSRLGVQAVSDPTSGRVVFAPTAGNDLSEYMALQFNAISSGEITASQAKVALADLVSSDDAYKPFAGQLSSIQNSLDAFEKKDSASKDAGLKYEYDRSQATSSAIAPTRMQAMADYYKSVGVPQLALLGDPSMGYDIPASPFVDKKRVNEFQAMLQREQNLAAQGLSRKGAGADYASKQAEIYSAMGNRAQATRAAEDATSGMAKGIGWLDDPVTKLLNIASSAKIFGGLFGGNTEDRAKADKDAKFKNVYEQVLKRLPQTAPNSISVSDLDPKYKYADVRAKVAQQQLDKENAFGAEVARLISEGLKAKGITPFNTNMQQLLGYAVESKKK